MLQPETSETAGLLLSIPTTAEHAFALFEKRVLQKAQLLHLYVPALEDGRHGELVLRSPECLRLSREEVERDCTLHRYPPQCLLPFWNAEDTELVAALAHAARESLRRGRHLVTSYAWDEECARVRERIAESS